MTYSYDSYGWLSSAPIAGRETTTEPPAHGDKTPGEPFPNWTGTHWVMVPYSEPVIPAPVVERVTRLTKLAFMDRFTDEELIDIYSAAKVEVAVEVWLAKLNAVTPEPDGTSIDLKDPRTISGVQGLEAARLLATGRAAEILA